MYSICPFDFDFSVKLSAVKDGSSIAGTHMLKHYQEAEHICYHLEGIAYSEHMWTPEQCSESASSVFLLKTQLKASEVLKCVISV